MNPARAPDPGTTPQCAQRLLELQAWQAARLANTYRDLHENARYRAAVDFFLDDLYGPHDFRQRDRDLARALQRLTRVLPRSAVPALTRAIELDGLSAALDRAMVANLPAGPLTNAGYADAYQRTGQHESRRRQIELIGEIGADLERIVHRPWTGAALKAAHVPAHAIGLGTLQDFLERGYASFRQLGDARYLLDTIHERETRLMHSLFAGDAAALEPAATGTGAGS